jgi:hypothetical protein
MSITNSTYTLGNTQISGQTICVELHTDSDGKVHRIEYLASIGTNYTAVMVARAAMLEGRIKYAELHHAIFTGEWNYVLTQTTANELAAFVRALYRESDKDTLARVAKRILEWITNGRFTDAQIRTAFGLSAAQWTTLKSKMQILADARAAVEAATGE